MSLKRSMPRRRKRLGYGLVSESANVSSAAVPLGLTVVRHRTVAARHDSTNSTPPPSNTGGRSLQLAPALGVRPDHPAPPLANGAEVLGQRLHESVELWGRGVGHMGAKAEAVVLDNGRELDRVVEKDTDLPSVPVPARQLTCSRPLADWRFLALPQCHWQKRASVLRVSSVTQP